MRTPKELDHESPKYTDARAASPKNIEHAEPLPASVARNFMLRLPAEIISDIFAHNMVGNAATALNNTLNLAVTNSSIKSVLGVPGPHKKLFQRLLTQRQIIKDFLDTVPEYMQMASFAPLWDGLSEDMRALLMAKSLRWLREPPLHEHMDTVSRAFGWGCINTLLRQAESLSDDDLLMLLEVFANYDQFNTSDVKADVTFLERMSNIKREKLLTAAEQQPQLARFLLRVKSPFVSNSELNKLFIFVLAAAVSEDDEVPVGPMCQRAAARLDGAHVAEAVALLLQKPFDSLSSKMSFLSGRVAIGAVDVDKLCASLWSDYNLGDQLPGLRATFRMRLGENILEMHEQARTHLMPMLIDGLNDGDDPTVAVEALVSSWPVLSEAQRGQLSNFMQSNQEILSTAQVPSRPKLIVAEGLATVEQRACIKSINDLRTSNDVARLQEQQEAAHHILEAYLGTNSTAPLHEVAREALQHLPAELVRNVLLKLINENSLNDPFVPDALQALSFLRTFSSKINPAQVDTLSAELMALPRSSGRDTAINALCELAVFMSDSILHKLAQLIASESGDEEFLLIGAMRLLGEQGRMSSQARYDLTLRCMRVLKTRESWTNPELAAIIARENHL